MLACYDAGQRPSWQFGEDPVGAVSDDVPHVTRVLLLGAFLAAASAHAQATGGIVSTPLGENNGIRVGPGRLHPYFDLEGRYDSAAIYVPSPSNPNTLELKPES